jgi:subtilisin family serine protease
MAIRRHEERLMRLRVIGTSLLAALCLAGGVASGEARPEETSYVVRTRSGTGAAELAAAARSLGGRVTGTIPGLRLAEVVLDPAGAARLVADPAVAWIRPEVTLHVAGGRPNDPLFARQWPLRKMDALRGWRTEDGTANEVVVAVIDSGVDASHPDLRNRVVDGLDLANGDDDPSDDNGHGTHVAGIVAAQPDNRRGIAGVSWGARVMPLKACDVNGACGSFDVAAAIVYAARSGARVVNISLSGAAGGCPTELALAAAVADAERSLLVASAGNSAQDGNPVMYPAACDGYTGVGATTPDDRWAPFSEHGEYVDLSAPGVAVPSTIPPGLAGMSDDPSTPGYGPADGTSMAAPHVAGLAALLFAQHPEWTPAEVEERMQETAVDLGADGPDEYFGAGRIDIARAVAAR